MGLLARHESGARPLHDRIQPIGNTAHRGALDQARINGNARKIAEAMTAPADQTSAMITSARQRFTDQSAKRAQLLSEALLARSNGFAPPAQ